MDVLSNSESARTVQGYIFKALSKEQHIGKICANTLPNCTQI